MPARYGPIISRFPFRSSVTNPMPSLCGLSRMPPARKFLKNDLRSLRLLTAGLGFATNRFASQWVRSNTPRNVAPFDGCHRPSRNGPRTSANRRASHGHPAREREAGSRSWRSAGAVSPSMTVPATAPRRPFSAHSSLFGRHISTTVSAGKPSAKSKRADITKGHALSRTARGRPNARSIFGRLLSPRLRFVMARPT